MSYIGLALYAEGPTDHRFLRPFLRRSVEALVLRRGDRPLDVSQVEEVHPTPAANAGDRAHRILDAAHGFAGGFHILFVHADSDGDRERALRERVVPGADLVESKLGSNGRSVVPVVPVRATEAWALADADCLRLTFSTDKSDDALGLPRRPAALEHEPSPKALLEDVYRRARPEGRRRRRSTAADYLAVLGETVRLDCVRRLPAYVALEADLTATLKRLGYIA